MSFTQLWLYVYMTARTWHACREGYENGQQLEDNNVSIVMYLYYSAYVHDLIAICCGVDPATVGVWPGGKYSPRSSV